MTEGRTATPLPGPPEEPNTKSLGPHKTHNMTISLYDVDAELLAWLRTRFGSSRSDVVRTAIRALALHLKAIEKEGGK